jgi:hypothetical protein
MSYGRYAKKSDFAFFERLKLLDGSCVRWHLGIPSDYRNGIGGILNVSFWHACFVKKIITTKKYDSWPKYEKSRF